MLGLIHQLGSRVNLVTANEGSSTIAPLAEARVFDDAFAYFRVASVTSNLPEAFRAAYKQINETNKTKIKGLVLDLRFADGFDYAAAAKVADCFLSSDHPLLNWQTGSAHATLKSDPIALPVAILINSQTSGAAEALAAVLRESDVGLILGGQTEGKANIFKEFPLSDGDKLRVAVAQVSFGSGKTLAHGLTPDIAIGSSLEDERAYLQDPFQSFASVSCREIGQHRQCRAGPAAHERGGADSRAQHRGRPAESRSRRRGRAGTGPGSD